MAVSISLNPNGVKELRVQLTDNTTITIQQGFDGQELTVLFQQDGSGSHTVTFGTGITGSLSLSASAYQTTIGNFQYDAAGNNWILTSQAEG
jgi:hypothetical protein